VTFRIAHLSDSHIGYEAYKALSASGENQRSVDVAKAFVTAVSEIVDADPPLVIHSGDLADRTVIPIRLILMLRQQIQRLAGVRPDGSRRQVVLLAGNHELPRQRKEACFLHLFEGLPGVQVVTRDYTQVRFPDQGATAGRDPALTDVVVHALPHDALKTVDFDAVRPLDGVVNVLTAHGVAGGSELYLRSLGREFSIPTEVLSRSWEYGALGHWHKQGPVPLLSTGAQADTDKGRVWYAGSTENMGFGDLKENGTRRGWLHVTVRPGADPDVERRFVPTRNMLRLPVLSGTGLDPNAITEALLERVRATAVSGAVVGQIVEDVPRDVWSLVDVAKVRAAAGDALHYEVSLRTRVKEAATDGSPSTPRGMGEVDRVLAERAEALLAEHERAGALLLARELLAAELERSSAEAAVTAETLEAEPLAATKSETPPS
jgi:DNA repair exonuclease SbcCD nuclease subunit